jgi:glutaryl-CoA dehydrogenase
MNPIMDDIPYADADLLGVLQLLSPEERERFDGLRAFFRAEVAPAATGFWKAGESPLPLLPRFAAQNMTGVGLPHASPLLHGLAIAELARADLSTSILFAVHNELFVGAIELLGSDAHRAELLPDLLALRRIGAFALTEPEHGSDISRSMTTTATRDDDGWVIRGSKRWIGNATFADYVVVWARDTADGEIKGFLVETDRPGFRATLIDDKIAVRAVQNADVEFDDVRIPFENWLPGTGGFRDTNVLLLNSRVLVGWQAVGLQLAAFDVARAYALERTTFGRPIAGYQLVQEQLVRMLGNATMSLGLMVQLARMQDEGSITMDQAAMAKAMCTLRMRETVALGRAMMAGNGISLAYEMAKIFADAEAVYTYEGTYEMNALIVGRAITGLSAFG